MRSNISQIPRGIYIAARLLNEERAKRLPFFILMKKSINTLDKQLDLCYNVNLTGLEPASLKLVFSASFVKCVLVIFIYNCAHLRQNLLKNTYFKVLRSFYV